MNVKYVENVYKKCINTLQVILTVMYYCYYTLLYDLSVPKLWKIGIRYKYIPLVFFKDPSKNLN